MKVPMKFVFIWVVAIGVFAGASLRSQTPAVEAAAELSPGTAEVLKLVKAGVDENVLLGFIGNSTNAFHLSADDLIYLQNNGVPPDVTTAMLQRDQALRGESTAATSSPAIPAATNSPVYQSPINPPATIDPSQPAVEQFHDALAPHGSWFQLPEWGWVWRPKEAATNAEWRPYLDGGRWVWSDHGWYWESDYPWGWAGFHYGRWLQLEKIGWVWFPDTVWAPSWVTWRYDDNNVGWAPLPPNSFTDETAVVQPVVNNYDYGVPPHYYTFVDIRYIFVPNVRPHCLPEPRVRECYRRGRVINDFGPGKHHGVVNRGIPIERISAGIGKQLTPVPVFKVADSRRDHAGRRSPGALPEPPNPGLRVPGYSHTMPHGSHQSPGTGAPSSRFAIPASPRLPAAPGTPGTVAKPINPVASPMNPAITPMNPNGGAVPRYDARTQPFRPETEERHGRKHGYDAHERGDRVHVVPVPAPSAPIAAPSQPATSKAWGVVNPHQAIQPVIPLHDETQAKRSLGKSRN